MKALTISVLLLALVMVGCDSGLSPTEPEAPVINCKPGDTSAACVDSFGRPPHDRDPGEHDESE